MLNRIKELLAKQGITLAAPISLSHCTIQRPYLLQKAEIPETGSAVIFAIPYYSKINSTERNCSRYAVGQDYHLFVESLSQQILPPLQKEFPENRFAMFADHSPLDERTAAALAGLGIIGKNGLLITEDYSSYVFLGEIVTDGTLCASNSVPESVPTCHNCGACLAACPWKQGSCVSCLSQLTQKKGKLTSEEWEQLARYGSAWGCDICQEACPYTLRAIAKNTIETPIPFFKEGLLPHLTYRQIRDMSDADFTSRAYAWRGREVILRNLDILEGNNEKEQSNTHLGKK